MSLTENLDLVFQPRTDTTHVHKVIVITVHPLILDIVDKEFQIGRNPGWLNGTKINSNN